MKHSVVLDSTKQSTSSVGKYPRWKRYFNERLAREISSITRYCDQVVQWRPLPADSGYLLSRLDCPKRSTAQTEKDLSDWPGDQSANETLAVFVNGTFNHHHDVQGAFTALKPKLNRSSRVIVVAYNPYFSWLYRLANFLGLRKGEQPTTFLTKTDFKNIAALSGFELVRFRPVAYCPFWFFGLGSVFNFLMPLLPFSGSICLAGVLTFRPILPEAKKRPSLTIVIPARNEKGNIENALKRMPDFGAPIEIIFVEGHSKDGTWEEIQRVLGEYSSRYSIKAFRQQGKGKNDAVKVGFAASTCDLITVLDADLTMPPELLVRFYDAYCKGLADFINGSRLVYAMEGEAMQFLNRLGNIFFAKALSAVLGMKIGDSLCGTKLFSREDYARISRWGKEFGDFDPFGDFELLFPAAILGLGVVDVPIRYLARTYGKPNISRFTHGFMLLKMTLIGLFRIKTGR